MARRSIYGLVFFVVAGCAAPEKANDAVQTRRDGGGSDGSGGFGGSGGSGGVGGSGGAGGGVPSDLAGVSCSDGGACMTGNPGACGSGHLVCGSGGAATCVPDVTTQSCYSGPAGTMGKGVCKAGNQICVSMLGSCDGEVTPAAAENCFNDLDDDCDGTVNNGCPDHLVTGTPVALTAQGNTGASSPFSLRCPANSYVTRAVVYGDDTDQYIAGIDIACATPKLVRGTSSYSVTPTAVTPNPASVHAANITTSVNDTFDCGTSAFTPGFYVPGAADSGGIDELGVSCSTGALTLSATNQLTITLTKGPNQGKSGYTGFLGEADFEDDCPAGSVLVGFDGLDGDGWFDAIKPVCAPLQVVYK